MKLSDVVSGAGLAIYAEIAMVLFMLVFLIVGLRVLFTRKNVMDEAARLPLAEDNFSEEVARRING